MNSMLAQVSRLWWRLIRFGFWLLYNDMAFMYDVVSKTVSLGMWRCWQRTVFRHIESSYDVPVLELAHGTGDLQLDLVERSYSTIGFDLSPYMGQITAQKLNRQGFQPLLVRGKGQQLPFADAYFPVIVCTFPTPFILAMETLRETYRVLRPGGKLVVVMNGLLTGRTPSAAFIEWLYAITGQRDGDMEGVLSRFRSAGFDARLVHELCPRSMASLIIAEKSVNSGLDT